MLWCVSGGEQRRQTAQLLTGLVAETRQLIIDAGLKLDQPGDKQ